jgi:hypothetical protein
MVYGFGASIRPPYSVELWDQDDTHVEELIALTGDFPDC